MDLALISTLLLAVNAGIKCALVSYDIGCQWSKNLNKRLALYSISSSFKLSDLTYWRVVVPKFHLAGHGKECQLKFNINFTKGAGRMSGEMIESGWAQSGSMAIWTRENGPFARRAVLDDHWDCENWRKLRRLRKFGLELWPSPDPTHSHLTGTTLLKNLKRALSWSRTHRAIADNVSKSLPEDTLAAWIKVRQEFDQDPSKPNPYQEPETCMFPGPLLTDPVLIFSTVVTVESLRRQLDNDNESDSHRGHTPPHTMTPGTLIWTAIQIEEQQYVSLTYP